MGPMSFASLQSACALLARPQTMARSLVLADRLLPVVVTWSCCSSRRDAKQRLRDQKRWSGPRLLRIKSRGGERADGQACGSVVDVSRACADSCTLRVPD